MARPPRYETAQLLDAATGLAAAGGPAAVTMAAVAKAAGAPSGSVYHRFADRPALLSAMWLRSLDRFHRGYLEALGSDRDPRTAARAATRYIVEWSRGHPADAQVLRYGAADFGLAGWPAGAAEQLDAANERIFAAIGDVARQLGATDPVARERVMVALVDLPYALVQRHLRSGTPIPAHTADTAEQCTAALLGQHPVPTLLPWEPDMSDAPASSAAPAGRRPATAELLDLRPHEEGGWFRETWRTGPATEVRPPGYPAARAAASGIYYCLQPYEVSRWHTVRSDEVWLWHRGGPLRLDLAGDGPAPDRENVTSLVLGPDLEEGQRPQLLVPAGHWQSARPAGGQEVLVSCIVAPAFHYDDFVLEEGAGGASG